MKEFLKKELYSFRAVAAILARWLLLAVPPASSAVPSAQRSTWPWSMSPNGGPSTSGCFGFCRWQVLPSWHFIR